MLLQQRNLHFIGIIVKYCFYTAVGGALSYEIRIFCPSTTTDILGDVKVAWQLAVKMLSSLSVYLFFISAPAFNEDLDQFLCILRKKQMSNDIYYHFLEVWSRLYQRLQF